MLVSVASCAGSAGDGTTDDGGGGEHYKLTVGSAAPESGQGAATLKRWAETIEEESDGRITVDFSWAGERVPTVDMLAGLKDGRLQASALPYAYWPKDLPFAQVTAVPFQTHDHGALVNALWDVLQDGPLADELAKHDLRPQFFTPMGTTTIHVREPLTNVADLDGLRVRAVGNLALAFNAAGGDGAAMDPTEIYQSIERGVLDGTSFTFDGAPSHSFTEVAPYTVDAGLGHYSAINTVISQRFWDELPPDLQDVVAGASTQAREMAVQDLADTNEGNCAYFKEAGAKFDVWDVSEVQAWSDLVGDGPLESWYGLVEASGSTQAEAEQFRQDFLAAYSEHDETDGAIGAASDVATCEAS